jgi:ribonuclease HI
VTDHSQPETLTDLLRTLERSGDLRSLARECGLSVRELRRRLAIWRRELQDGDDEQGPGTVVPLEPAPGRRVDPRDWPDLPAAADVARNPLPAEGPPVMRIHTDGASRGNPGPAAIGIVFGQVEGPDLCVHSEAIGRATNNVAEYRAVVTALEHCRRWGVRRVRLLMDSELIVRQLHGAYRVKSPDLRPHYQQVVFLSRELEEFRVRHVRREENGHADALANRALDA